MAALPLGTCGRAGCGPARRAPSCRGRWPLADGSARSVEIQAGAANRSGCGGDYQSEGCGKERDSAWTCRGEAGAAGRAVDVSYDAGRTWRTATIKASGTRHLLILHHPTTGEHVALRAHLVDRDGNTATQTRINAYAVATPWPQPATHGQNRRHVRPPY